ncbi:flagellar filament capping protein FliD [Cellulosimicrobium funkei]|nr:flagellar filament capping protein FliD [Cellulosimicrobium funkei]
MAGISFDGLASGLNTTELIGALISVERVPVTLMENKLAENEARVSGLRSLNSQIAALAALAKEHSTAEAFRPATGSSTSQNVTVTVDDGATPATLDFRVDAAASKHSGVSAPLSGWSGETLSITRADGTTADFTGDSLSSLVNDINGDAELGVDATLIKAGTDAEGTTLYRLQLTSRDTGSDAAFTATRADGTDVFGTGGAITSTAADAQITLFPGTGAEQTVTSATNEFADLASGVSITVSAKAVGETVTASASNDPTAATERAEKLLKQINALLNAIGSVTTVTPGSGSSGSTTSAGMFVGDSTVRSVNDKIFSAAVRTEDGTSQAWFGVQPDRYGRLEIDTTKLMQALTEDPAAVGAALASLAGRVSDAATSISDKYDGILTKSIESRVTENQRTQTSIDSALRRLEMRETTLRAQFTAMEVALAKANSLQSYLSGQINTNNAAANQR